MIAYPERNCFRLGPAQGIPKQNFREIWVEIGETFKQNLGDSSAKLWSMATHGLTSYFARAVKRLQTTAAKPLAN